MTQLSKQKKNSPSSHVTSSDFMKDFFNFNWPSSLFPEANNGLHKDWLPEANIKDLDSSFSVEMSVPGFSKDSVTVELENETLLKIRGESSSEKEENDEEKFTRREYKYNSFSRSFELPQAVDENKITAKIVDGILTIDLPKIESSPENKKIREIQIS